MKAVIQDRYGPPESLRLAEVPTPDPGPDQARIRIRAVSINGSDRENLAGRPLYTRMAGLRKPTNPILGSDIAGTVDVVGADHAEFEPGAPVFGELPGYHGGFAEYACTHGRTLAHKPDELSFTQAAAIPQGGVIAWNGIVSKGKVRPGQHVLINGAGGSAGVFAVQLAKRAGAEVTGVDNAHKQDFMREIGADHVLDYGRADFTRTGERYDLILDLVAHRSVFAYARALNPGGRYFVVGGSTRVLIPVLLLGPLIRRAMGKRLQLLAVPQNRADLLEISALCVSGEIKVVIDREFSLEDTPEAMWYVANGRAKGKVVIRGMES